jgi:hypothetical protein
MPLINYLKHYKAAVEKVLPPGEQLIDLGLYHEPFIGDESRLARSRDELSPRMRRYADQHGSPPPSSEKLVEGFDPVAGLHVNDNRIARFFGGLSGEGPVDSTAGRWWRAVKDGAGTEDSTEYGVTNRRLLLLTSRTRSGNTEYKIIFDVPRGQVASVVRRGKLLFQRGRVEVRFTDRSMIAFTTGMLTTGRARALVAALSDAGTRAGEA